MKQLYLHKNHDPSSSGPTEQLSINNQGRFSLTKVLKLRSKVMDRKIKFVRYYPYGKRE